MSELSDSSEFERYALSVLTPLPPTRPHTLLFDVAANKTTVALAGSIELRVHVGGVRELQLEVRPIAFGLAWKVLDLLLELAFYQDGHRPHNGRRWLIKEKTGLAGSCAGKILPLTGDVPLWKRLCATYSETEQARHSLVHRRAQVDPSTGSLTGTDENGQPLTPLTTDEQEAFCRAVQRCVSAVLGGKLTPRERADTAWQLNQLAGHHGLRALKGTRSTSPPLLIVSAKPADEPVLLDVPALMVKAKATFSTCSQFDVAVDLSGRGRLIGELETAPQKVVRFSAASPPKWLSQEPR